MACHGGALFCVLFCINSRGERERRHHQAPTPPERGVIALPVDSLRAKCRVRLPAVEVTFFTFLNLYFVERNQFAGLL